MSYARLNALNIQYRILEKERNDLRASNTDLIGTVARLTAENVELRTKVAELESDISGLETQLHDAGDRY
jgi:predicted  nucleic acid-binding Zn-ribbon protein